MSFSAKTAWPALLALLLGSAVAVRANPARSEYPGEPARSLPAPVRLDIVRLTHLGGQKVQSVQLPVVRLEGNRVGTFRVGSDRYSVSAVQGFGNSIEVKIVYAVLEPQTLEYRTVAAPSVLLKPGKMVSIGAGREEFRIKADWVPVGSDSQSIRYTSGPLP